MRYIIFPFVFGCSLTVFGQSMPPLIKASSHPDSNYNNEWELSKYVWSHTHQTAAKDNKPLLDFNTIDNWTGVGPDEDLNISPDGKYVAYSLSKAKNMQEKLVVQSTTGSWRQEFKGASPGFFSADSKLYIYQSKEGLCFLAVNETEPRILKEIVSFNKPRNGKNEWLAWQEKSNNSVVLKNLLTGKEVRFEKAAAYNFNSNSEWLAVQLNNEAKELVVYNLQKKFEQRYPFISGYRFAESGKALLLKTATQTGSRETGLQYANFENRKISTIWPIGDQHGAVNSYSINSNGEQVVFVAQPGSSFTSTASNSVWYWQEGMNKPVMRANNETAGIDTSLFIQGASFFANGSHIVLTLQQRKDSRQQKTDAIQLDVWSHKDKALQSMQPDLLKKQNSYRAIINEQGKAIVLEDEFFHFKSPFTEDFVVLAKSGKEINGDRFWEPDYDSDSNWLVSLKNGSRTSLASDANNLLFSFSPRGRYLVYFDAKKNCNYFSLDLKSGRLSNISAQVPVWQLGRVSNIYYPKKKPKNWVGIAGWLKDDKGVLVYDEYDIWLLDLSGKNLPINVTNGYGRLNGLQFCLRRKIDWLAGIEIKPSDFVTFSEDEKLLLSAFNERTKSFGVYKKTLGVHGNPQPLYSASENLFVLAAAGCSDEWHMGNIFSDKKDTSSFIVTRESATMAKNYFLTRDFKSFRPLTDFEPHKGYQWFSADLCEFKHANGIKGEGILFKPESFDSGKKYPVLIVFYNQHTNDFNRFRKADFVWSGISPITNPAWMVNHGYLVFVPDIYITPLKYGPSALNVIEGAVKYLRQLSFVDGDHIGAGSHSWSAKLGTYVFTHSKSFAATVISEGFLYANPITTALSVGDDFGLTGESELSSVEVDWEYGNLWENKSTWLDQTAVLNADKAGSPLLLYCGKQSSNDYQNQTLQLFTALRRLEKKAWWLHYDNSGHVLWQDDAKDFTIRYTQYFDHYLKEAPAPKWMTQGIPYKLRGIENGLELDPGGSCGKDCKVCKKWNDLYKKTPEMFTKPVSEWSFGETSLRTTWTSSGRSILSYRKTN